MSRKRNSTQIICSTVKNINCDQLAGLFDKISLNDQQTGVDPKTKKVKKDSEQTTNDEIPFNIHSLSKCPESSTNEMIAIEIIRMGQKLEDVSKKINTLNKFIHDHCILKEQCSYIN